MNVRNVNRHRDKTGTSASWLDHWIRFSGKPLSPYCSEKWCVGLPDGGAHVQKDSATDAGWYIIPLCTAHIQETGATLQIADTVALVPAEAELRGGSERAAPFVRVAQVK